MISESRFLPSYSSAVVCLGASLLLGACGYTSPHVSVVDAQATERTPDGLAMRFTIEAANENEDALPLRDVEYTVELDGKQVFRGTRSAEATVRRLGSQRFTLPAVVSLADHPDIASAASFANYRVSGTLQYVTPGTLAEVLFDAGVRVPSVGFAGEGRIDLSGARTVLAFSDFYLFASGAPQTSAGAPAESGATP